MSIAGVGDVNGDKVGDFAIGSVEQDFLSGGPSAGMVQVFFGAADVAALMAPDVTLTSGQPTTSLARAWRAGMWTATARPT